MRHGYIQKGRSRRYIGQTDLPLSSRGINQAIRWRTWLQKLGLEKIFASDLQRSKQTAELIQGDNGPPVHLLTELREIDLGLWDGEMMSVVREQFPAAYKERGVRIKSFRPPHGESFRDLSRRIVPFFNEIRESTSGNVLVVGHAGVNRVIVCHLLGIPLDRVLSFSQDYGTIWVIEPEGSSIRSVGEVSRLTLHLDGENGTEVSGPALSRINL